MKMAPMTSRLTICHPKMTTVTALAMEAGAMVTALAMEAGAMVTALAMEAGAMVTVQATGMVPVTVVDLAAGVVTGVAVVGAGVGRVVGRAVGTVEAAGVGGERGPVQGGGGDRRG